MRIIIEDEEAVERVRRHGGDKSATETVARLIREADGGRCANLRGDGRACGAPLAPGVTCCAGCAPFAPKRTRKGAK